MKSPIKWKGGKSGSVKTILPIIPSHNCYVEPFFGGGWVFFAKDKSSVEVINDINNQLINFYEVLRTKETEFIDRMNMVLRSRHLFLEYRSTLNDKSLSDVERAFRFYYVNQNAFSGLIRYNTKGECNSAFAGSPNKEAKSSFWNMDKIRKSHDRLRDTIIESDSYENIVKRYDRVDTLFFLDPPYEGKDKRTYNGATSFDYETLIKVCRGIKGKFILTLNAEFEDMFSEFNVYPNKVHYSMGCTSKSSKSYKEVIITNYEIKNKVG